MQKIKITIGVALLFGLVYFVPKNQVDALPGFGGTITNECVRFVCSQNCLEVGVQYKSIPISLSGGGTYEKVIGTERSCGDELAYCAWDAGCKI